MTTLTLTLQRKSLTVRVESGVYAQKLSFQALLAKGHSLCNHEGAEVCSGYVELVTLKKQN